MRVSILTVSDSVANGEREDLSGRAIVEWCAGRGDSLVRHDVVTDETVEIVARLVEWCDAGDCDLVLTTGGTGLSPRDVTPVARRGVSGREAEGLAVRDGLAAIHPIIDHACDVLTGRVTQHRTAGSVTAQ